MLTCSTLSPAGSASLVKAFCSGPKSGTLQIPVQSPPLNPKGPPLPGLLACIASFRSIRLAKPKASYIDIRSNTE